MKWLFFLLPLTAMMFGAIAAVGYIQTWHVYTYAKVPGVAAPARALSYVAVCDVQDAATQVRVVQTGEYRAKVWLIDGEQRESHSLSAFVAANHLVDGLGETAKFRVQQATGQGQLTVGDTNYRVRCQH